MIFFLKFLRHLEIFKIQKFWICPKFRETLFSETDRNFTEISRNAIVRNFAKFDKVVNISFCYDKFADFHR